MMDLFPAPSLSRDTFSARGLTVVPMRGDAMSPTLRGGRDYVLAAPVKRFTHDGIYVVEMDGEPCIYRVQSRGNGQIGLIFDNEAYGATPMERTRLYDRAWFDAHVLGIVVADIIVREADHMRRAAQ